MEVLRLFDLLPYQATKYPQSIALAEKVGDTWRTFSSKEICERIDRASKGLIALGIEPGDKVSVISPNNVAWNTIDLAVLQIGAVHVPIYPNVTEEMYSYILQHAGVKTAFVEGVERLSTFRNIQEKLDSLTNVFSIGNSDEPDSWQNLFVLGDAVSDDELAQRKESVQPEDLATIMYTSGTTGKAKGVMLSHNNILSNVKSITQLLPITHEHRVLSFLPLCHIFERMVCYTYFYLGSSIYYAENLDTVMENVQEIKPHFFTTVPRLLEKIYEGLLSKGSQLPFPIRKLYFLAVSWGLRFQIDVDQGSWYNFRLRIANKLIFSRWRKALGGELIGIVTGAASLPPLLCKVFSAAGIMIREGYGQTEASPVITFNRFEPGGTLEGTVGMPIPGVEVKIAADGEICVRGPNVMMGYYNDLASTEATIDEEGWLHTGDVGKLVQGRFLKITDRIKELVQTANGKYLAPHPIESRFKASPFIDQIMIVGNRRPFISALIVPSFSQLETWAREQEVSFSNRYDLLTNNTVHTHYQQLIDRLNEGIIQTECVKQFKLLPKSWTVASGELTPTLKLKRKVIEEKYEELIEALYQ